MNKRFLVKCVAVFASLFAGILPQTAFAQQQWSMGYWSGANGDTSGQLPWGAVTHINYWSVGPVSDGTISFNCGPVSCNESGYVTYASALVTLAHSHGVKVIMGYRANVSGAPEYLGAMGSANLNKFVANTMRVVNECGFDGVWFDWENSINWAIFRSALSAFRTALGSKLLGIDQFSTQEVSGLTSGSPATWTYLDRLNVEDYDLPFQWEPYSWFNSAIYSDPGNNGASIDHDMSTWTSAGVALSKINISMAFYGYVVTGGSPPITGPRQAWNQSALPNFSQQNYANIAAAYNLSNPTWDNVAQSSWVGIANGWITFDDPQALTAKVHYAKNKGTGGWFIWNLGEDYIATANPVHPLAAAVQAAMGTSSSAPPSITTTSPLSAGTVGTPSSLSLTSSGATPITWTVMNGALPGGLSLTSSSGVISGTPSTAGSFSFTAQATNTAGIDSRQFSLTINPKSSASWFNLVSKNSGLCLDITGVSTSPGVQLQQWTCLGGDNQKFQFTPVQGGYEITAKNSGLQLDVQGGPSFTQNGVPIIQWPYWGGSNEIWNFVPSVDGSYSITALSSGKCVDVTGTSTSNGAMIQQWTCTGTKNQKWKLVPVQ